jgi:exopolyphosphatase/guanosine-5'-triphosphate,3'-diphosphate pyrophosphatase
MTIAVIDIGSNSIKLAIAESSREGGIRFLRREKESVRLGHNSLVDHHLSKESIGRAADTIASYRMMAERAGADRIVAVATAAVREADNEEQFIAEVTRKTGITVEVLSATEEARLIGIAAEYCTGDPKKSLLNIDIGGGSTELSLMKRGAPRSLQSVKIGAVRLSDQFIKNDPPDPTELSALRAEVEAALERPAREMRGMKWNIATGTSGTILSLGAALSDGTASVSETPSLASPQYTISLPQLSKLMRKLESMKQAERAAIEGINGQRAEIIIAGGTILETVMRAFRINKVCTLGWSLREGVILDRLWEEEDRPKVRPMEADLRFASAEALGERFGYEAAHGKQVAALTGQLFDQLQRLHELTPHHRSLAIVGALLHDIGYAISHESHHKHSQYLILHSELTGFTDQEKRIIANIARYHRKATPKPTHSEFNTLSFEDKKIVWKLGGIVRIADALDRSHSSRVRKVQCRIEQERVLVTLTARRCEQELWAVSKKSSMFEEAYNRKVEVRI